MSFPFSDSSRELRRRILLALGASGLLGISGMGGCAEESGPPTCDVNDGPPTKKCLTREEMDNMAALACSVGLPVRPPQETTPCQARTPAQIAGLFDENACLVPREVTDGCCNPAPNPGEPQSDGSCCYYHCRAHVCCGRPLLVAGRSRLAAAEPREDWVLPSARASLPLPAALRIRIAQQWLEDGLMEHASVAAFARFTLELLGFGAPAELVAQAQRAGLDEVAHARACFSLAQHYDGVARGPARLDLTGLVPASTLTDAVRCAFLEGCVGETQAALQAQLALRGAHEKHARAALKRIARDEARHSVLAWRFVAWAVTKHPECASAVEAALEHALAAAQNETLDTALPESSETRALLHAAGRFTTPEREAIAHHALTEVVAPCARALLTAAAQSSVLASSTQAHHDCSPVWLR